MRHRQSMTHALDHRVRFIVWCKGERLGTLSQTSTQKLNPTRFRGLMDQGIA